MIELVLTICALTFASPYYDCSTEWEIYVSDEEILPCGRHEDPSSLGCATYNSLFNKDKIELVNNHSETSGMWTPKLKYPTILNHELLHLKCQCNWHEYWDKSSDERKHKFNQRGYIPKDVIPYLKEGWAYS